MANSMLPGFFLRRDGKNKPTADFDWNNKAITNISSLSVNGAITAGSINIGTADPSAVLTIADGSTLTGTDQRGIQVSTSFTSATATSSISAVRAPIDINTGVTTSVVRGFSVVPTLTSGTITRFLEFQSNTIAIATNNACLADNTAFVGNFFLNQTGTRASILSGQILISTASGNITSNQANVATAGFIRLPFSGTNSTIQWRNTGNTANLALAATATDNIPSWNAINLVNISNAQTLTNKNLANSNNTLTGATAGSFTNTGTITLPTSTDTLVGRATTDTLTNKSISGATNTLSNIGDGSLSVSYLKADGTRALTGNWGTGSFQITGMSGLGVGTGSPSSTKLVEVKQSVSADFLINATQNSDSSGATTVRALSSGGEGTNVVTYGSSFATSGFRAPGNSALLGSAGGNLVIGPTTGGDVVFIRGAETNTANEVGRFSSEGFYATPALVIGTGSFSTSKVADLRRSNAADFLNAEFRNTAADGATNIRCLNTSGEGLNLVTYGGSFSTSGFAAPNNSSVRASASGGSLLVTSQDADVIVICGSVTNTANEVSRFTTAGQLFNTVGKAISIKEGSNAKMGTSVLVAGTVTVSNTSVTANSRIFVTSQADGGVPGFLRVTNKVNATSFDIVSSSVADTSTVAWIIFEAL